MATKDKTGVKKKDENVWEEKKKSTVKGYSIEVFFHKSHI